MKLKKALIAVALAPLLANAADLNVSGSVSANGGHVYASQYLQSIQQTYVGTYVYAGTYVQAQAYFYTPGYLNISGYGYIGNFLRIGGATNTPASKSVQIGQYATTDSFNSLVVGQYNVNKAKDGVTAPSPTTWQDGTGGTPIDPLFVVGNGTSTTPKNAFAVYKDGTITMSPQGDISMGQFGN